MATRLFFQERRIEMGTFIMFGKYSTEGLKGMSAARTKRAGSLIKKLGGQVQAIYATLGECDLVCVVTLPDLAAAMKASVQLGKMTGIAFTTAPAVEVAEFDKLMSRTK
jgi:uncharacterized protein with GYD domain